MIDKFNGLDTSLLDEQDIIENDVIKLKKSCEINNSNSINNCIVNKYDDLEITMLNINNKNDNSNISHVKNNKVDNRGYVPDDSMNYLKKQPNENANKADLDETCYELKNICNQLNSSHNKSEKRNEKYLWFGKEYLKENFIIQLDDLLIDIFDNIIMSLNNYSLDLILKQQLSEFLVKFCSAKQTSNKVKKDIYFSKQDYIKHIKNQFSISISIELFYKISLLINITEYVRIVIFFNTNNYKVEIKIIDYRVIVHYSNKNFSQIISEKILKDNSYISKNKLGSDMKHYSTSKTYNFRNDNLDESYINDINKLDLNYNYMKNSKVNSTLKVSRTKNLQSLELLEFSQTYPSDVNSSFEKTMLSYCLCNTKINKIIVELNNLMVINSK